MTIEAGALALRITEIGADQVLAKLDQIDKKASGLGKTTQAALQFNAPTATGVNGQLQAMTMNFTQASAAANTNTAATQQNATAQKTLTASLTEQLLTYQVARTVLRDVGQIIAFVTEAADNQTLAQRRLSAVARLTGTDLAFLQSVSADAQKTFHLSKASADDLTGQFAKLAERSGHVSMTGQAMNAWLDLGAANGLTLDQTLQALTTTLGGNDEGLNKLGLMNPSQIWKKWADAAGTTVGQMTDAQKWQAIVNEVVQQGGRVQGEYVKSLETTQGAQNAFNEKLKDTAAMFGHTLDSGRSMFYGIATAAMESALAVDKWWKGVGDTLRANITAFLERYPFLAKLARMTGDLPPEAAKNPVVSLESSANVNAASLQAQLDAAAGFKRPGPKLTAEEKAAARERAKDLAKAAELGGMGVMDPASLLSTQTAAAQAAALAALTTPTVGVDKSGKMKGVKKFGLADVVDAEFQKLQEKLKERQRQMQDLVGTIAQSVGQAFGNAFTAAFEGGNFFAEFGKGLISSLGNIIMQLGEQMLAYGLIIAPLASLLNFTPFGSLGMGAGASIAAGLALTALGAAMGAVGGHGGKGAGGGSGRGGNQNGQQDNTFALQFDPDGKLRKRAGPAVIPSSRALNNGAMPDARANVTVNATIIGPNDPTAQRQIGALIKNASDRGIDMGMRKAG